MALLHKLFFILFAVVIAYDDIDDNFDYDTVTKDIKALSEHLNCYLDRGPCSDVTVIYKNHIGDAVVNNCEKCSTSNRHQAKVFIQAVKEKLPEGYQALRKKFDPNGTLFDKLETFLAKY